MSNVKLPTTCDICGKRTNKVNRSTDNVDLCKSCFTKEELSNGHIDGQHEEYVAACVECNEERNKALEAATEDADDHWVDVHTRRQAGCIACDAVAANDIGQVDPVFYEPTEDMVHIEDITDQVVEEMKKQAHFDHSGCDHDKTPRARAWCRDHGLASVFHGKNTIEQAMKNLQADTDAKLG